MNLRGTTAVVGVAESDLGEVPGMSPLDLAGQAAVRALADAAIPKSEVDGLFTALHLVPAGKRIIRAEVEAEFVARVANTAGKQVTILDANDFSLRYPGVVRLVGTAFHPKRSQVDGLALHPVQVVECVVDIPDPAPSGRPALRVGQPVRVTFP